MAAAIETKIFAVLNKHNLDIRKSGNARFMDQKVTPDVLSIIADCIMNHTESDKQKRFTVKDIWNSQYFKKNVCLLFGKPSPENPNAAHEYDKFIAQPIKALAYAHILTERKIGLSNVYTIENYDILEFIATKEKNAFIFLCAYLEKVLNDSGFIKNIINFENSPTIQQFRHLKGRFQRFIIGNTPINGTTEVNRIFPKVLNVLAVNRGMPGSVKGRLSGGIFTYSDLMYNRENWRDLPKNKDITRREAIALSKNTLTPQYMEYLVQRAVNIIKNKYSQSEVRDQYASGLATQVHHIFLKSKYPEIAHYYENLIKLTAQQHSVKAHPKNNNRVTDPDYQMTCLISKSMSIEKSLLAKEQIYSEEDFIYVINKGLKTSLSQKLHIRAIRAELVKLQNVA
ncbi:MAG: hypothetical protein KJ757_00030 [Planctomycetes bacterium]|nr:hypothetical protein [Planctomycetota bacterium]MBU1518133.1 hypothetical protein [Planctomycetota bacterium]MBU2595941.1 hypothetical protein [Planctomycetota bacterium]